MSCASEWGGTLARCLMSRIEGRRVDYVVDHRLNAETTAAAVGPGCGVYESRHSFDVDVYTYICMSTNSCRHVCLSNPPRRIKLKAFVVYWARSSCLNRPSCELRIQKASTVFVTPKGVFAQRSRHLRSHNTQIRPSSLHA